MLTRAATPRTEANDRPQEAHPAATKDKIPAPKVICSPPLEFKNLNLRSTSSRFTPKRKDMRVISIVFNVPRIENEPMNMR